MAKPSPSYAGATELVQLGRTIRELRSNEGYSQEAFADAVGIERGEHNLELMNLNKIASALNITHSDLFIEVKL